MVNGNLPSMPAGKNKHASYLFLTEGSFTTAGSPCEIKRLHRVQGTRQSATAKSEERKKAEKETVQLSARQVRRRSLKERTSAIAWGGRQCTGLAGSSRRVD